MHPQHKQCVDRDSSCKLYRNSTAGQQCACHITGQLQMCTVNISFISKCSYGFPKNLCKSPKDHQVVIRGTVDVTKHATTCSACSMEARCPTCTATSAPPKQLHHPRLHAATQHQSTSSKQLLPTPSILPAAAAAATTGRSQSQTPTNAPDGGQVVLGPQIHVSLHTDHKLSATRSTGSNVTKMSLTCQMEVS